MIPSVVASHSKTGSKLETSHVLVLSTAHVPYTTAIYLDRTNCKDWPWAGAKWQHGWFFYVADENVGEPAIPPKLYACMEFAREHGFDWVRFDADGPIVADLAAHEW